MDNEMIERVALVIANSKRAKHNIGACHWHHLTEEAKIEYLGYARAAIKAMREPTEKMTRVGGMFLPDYDPSDDDAKDCWQNMIDAVLND